MKAMIKCVMVLALAASLGYIVDAEDKQDDKVAKKETLFDKIKSMNGEWEVTKGPGDHGDHKGVVTYKVTAGGSAVLETVFGGTDHEMVTLYYMDDGKLSLTHYCMLQNRPLMRVDPQSTLEKLVFKCQEKENPKLDAEDHMHEATINFIDGDHVKTDWVLYKGGKADSTHGFELARKKSSTVGGVRASRLGVTK